MRYKIEISGKWGSVTQGMIGHGALVGMLNYFKTFFENTHKGNKIDFSVMDMEETYTEHDMELIKEGKSMSDRDTRRGV